MCSVESTAPMTLDYVLAQFYSLEGVCHWLYYKSETVLKKKKKPQIHLVCPTCHLQLESPLAVTHLSFQVVSHLIQCRMRSQSTLPKYPYWYQQFTFRAPFCHPLQQIEHGAAGHIVAFYTFHESCTYKS